MICQNCGHENDMDATFCERCGARLGPDPDFGRRQRGYPEKSGMSSSTKLLIVVIVVLVAVLGIAAGLLMQSNQVANTATGNDQVSVSESQEQVTYKAQWHKVTSFSGIDDDYRSFTIKGDQFKVVMSATPILNYNTNFMNIDVSDLTGIIGSGELNWGPTDAQSTKEKTVKFTGSSGTYDIDISTKDLESWTVTIYDYY